jgi:hypothetical protein
MIEGFSDAAAPVILIMGIGMLLSAVTHPQAAESLSLILQNVIPRQAVSYVLIFTVFAPLSLYRGPLNIWGLGSGVVALLMHSRILPLPAIMAALMAVGQMQGVCDPTNTHNVWIANFVGVNTMQILRKTILYMWVVAFLGLVAAAWLFF